MVQKILLTMEIDDSQLDAAQAKADKLLSTVERIQDLLENLVFSQHIAKNPLDVLAQSAKAAAEVFPNEKPPKSGERT